MHTQARISNKQTGVTALGLALHAGHAVYVSATGPQTALKSIWASLVKTRPDTRCWEWSGYQPFTLPHSRQFWVALPDSNWQHAIFTSTEPGILLACRPAAALLDNIQRQKQLTGWLDEETPTIFARFTAYLNQATNTPVLAEWGKALWQAGNDEGAVKRLSAYGDCIGAWAVDASFDWTTLTQRLIRQGEVAL